MTAAHQLPIWVVYDHPSDFPDCFVARLWDGLQNAPTDTVLQAATLDALRALLPPDLYPMARLPEDDPTIVECWL